jgi:hypothetical protein
MSISTRLKNFLDENQIPYSVMTTQRPTPRRVQPLPSRSLEKSLPRPWFCGRAKK